MGLRREPPLFVTGFLAAPSLRVMRGVPRACVCMIKIVCQGCSKIIREHVRACAELQTSCSINGSSCLANAGFVGAVRAEGSK